MSKLLEFDENAFRDAFGDEPMAVTHNLAQARRIADRVAVFWIQENAGRLIECGPTAEVFQSPRDPLTAAYVNGTRG